jgi:16S rRNA (guanine(966)-N(2))-methyltransferase RsmD
MRIISGTLKGRLITVPKNFRGRPTTDFAREGLFNMLGHMIDMEGIAVLDLFAGTGAFGLECLSRGAGSVLAIDQQPLHVKFIQQNFDAFGFENAEAMRVDVFRYLNKPDASFDLVFADPPYDLKQLKELPDTILSASLLNETGLLVVEHGKNMDFTAHPACVQSRQFSNVWFSFFRKKQS